VAWLSDLCAFKAHIQGFEEKEDQPSVQNTCRQASFRRELLLATSSGHNDGPGSVGRALRQSGQVEPDGVPRQQGAEIVCDEGFALRS
jgi:hypothetical protein